MEYFKNYKKSILQNICDIFLWERKEVKAVSYWSIKMFLLFFGYPPVITAGQVGEAQEQPQKAANENIFCAGNFICFIYMVWY